MNVLCRSEINEFQKKDLTARRNFTEKVKVAYKDDPNSSALSEGLPLNLIPSAGSEGPMRHRLRPCLVFSAYPVSKPWKISGGSLGLKIVV